MSIEIRNIHKQFGDFQALGDVSLDIHSGELIALLGPSGCGKTTLLRIIAGLEIADSGTILFSGEDTTHVHVRERQVGFVFQHYALFRHMTVFENVAFGLRVKPRAERPSEEQIKKKVHDLLSLVQLDWLADRYPSQLSGGQRQRIALARALAVEPKVILMDEPLSNLDALLRLEMRAELKTILAKSQASTIYVTHDQVEAMSLADRIAIMDQGVIVQCDTPIEIYRNPATTFVAGFIGNPPMNFLPAKAVQDGVYEVAGMRLAGPAGYSELTLGVRPEDLHVADGGLKLQADVIEPLGAHTLVTALQAQGVFRAALPSDLALTPKQMLHLQPDLSRIRWYDGAGQMVKVG